MPTPHIEGKYWKIDSDVKEETTQTEFMPAACHHGTLFFYVKDNDFSDTFPVMDTSSLHVLPQVSCPLTKENTPEPKKRFRLKARTVNSLHLVMMKRISPTPKKA